MLNNAGNTALIIASRKGYLECVEALLKNKNCIPKAEKEMVHTWIYDDWIIEMMKKLIEESPDSYYLNTFGSTVLYYGCEQGSLETVEFIFEKDISGINCREFDGKTPLQVALCGSFLDIADYLARKGADLSILDADGKSAYDYAVEFDYSEEFLAKYEPEEHFLDELFKALFRFYRFKTVKAYAVKCAVKKYPNGPDILNRAISFAFESLDLNKGSIKILLPHCSDKNLIIQFAKKAVVYWTFEFFEMLYNRYLELETDREEIKKDRKHLFHLALSNNNTSVCNYLLEQGEDPNGSKDGQSYLIRACRMKNTSLAKSLLEFGADANTVDLNRTHPIHCAIELNQPEMIRIFLKHGANPLVKDKEGFTPLLRAACSGYKEPFFELFKMDKDLSQRSKTGMTPFLAACKFGNIEIIKALLEAGASGTDVDNRNRNCFHIAARLKCEFIIFMFGKLEKSTFLAMIAAPDANRYRPIKAIVKYRTGHAISNLLMAIPDLYDLIDAPICSTFVAINQESNHDMCLICRDDFVNDDRVTVLPCKHIYHEDCYSHFKRSKRCPYCRRRVFLVKK